MIFTVITGASKGIGKAMAQICAHKKMNLILIARSKPTLEKIAQELQEKYQVKVITYSADLSRPQTPSEIANWCTRHKYDVNFLINNAGCGYWGTFEKLPLSDQNNSIQLNVNSLVAMCHAFLPLLKKHKQSFILNVASIAAFMPMPYFLIYGATKSFVVSFSRGLRQELKKENVKVSCLCPGPTDSEFFGQAGMDNFKWKKEKFMMSAETVAKMAIEDTLKNKELIIPGVSNKLSKILSETIPSRLVTKFMGYIYKP